MPEYLAPGAYIGEIRPKTVKDPWAWYGSISHHVTEKNSKTLMQA